jgi:asparagine synthase (glutamine-hydrolysing)
MNNTIEHRGPDQAGVWIGDKFSIGQRRLAIIDLSEKGRQPMFNEDKSLTLVFNGEIYNYKELRTKLVASGHRFYSNTDSEAILHLYEEKGVNCLNDLDGIFAFAIYDIKLDALFLARDHLGVKPLYYFWNGKILIFSSEIKAILKHRIPKGIDKRALSCYFHLAYPLAPLTIYKNIFKLAPAHFLLYKNNHLEVKRYWRPPLPEKIFIKKEQTSGWKSREEVKEQIHDLTRKAVKKQMISDRPLGVFLSGGIDSTVITALAQEFSREKIKSFSVGFETKDEVEKFNFDFEMARRVSHDLGIEHYELMISAKDVLAVLEKVAWHMDEPLSNHTQPITYLLSEFAKKEVAVVLGGDGGDEIFAGYPRYRFNLLLDLYQKAPRLARTSLFNKALALLKKDKSIEQKLETVKGVERYLLFLAQKDDDLKRVVRREHVDNRWYFEELKRKYPNATTCSSVALSMLMDLENWLAEESLMRTDKTTMAWGLEERVPLLDRFLVEFALTIPYKYKISFFDSKIIFKEAMKDYLPLYVLKAPKRGWFSPMAKWLRTDLKEFSFEVLSPNYCSGTQEFFDFRALEQILADHISKKKYNLALIWSVITFQMWYKNFMC